MEYCVYILYSERSDKIYIGFTSSLISRFHSHNELEQKGFTQRYRPWVVVYCEYHDDKSSAMQREKQLKGAKAREWIRLKLMEEFKSVGFISA